MLQAPLEAAINSLVCRLSGASFQEPFLSRLHSKQTEKPDTDDLTPYMFTALAK